MPGPAPNAPGACRVARRACTLAVLALLAACAQRPAPSPPGHHEPTGRDIFLRRCASCHGLEGRGDGPVAATLRTAPADLTLLAARDAATFPRAHVIAVVTGAVPLAAHGSREMPVWSLRFGTPSGATTAATLWATRQLELLTDHLATIQTPAVPTSGAGSSADTP